MESRDIILQNINKLYDEYMAQISQGKIVKGGIFTGKTKGLISKKADGRGLMFYTSSKIIVSGQFEDGKVFGTYGEIRKDEYYAMYSIENGQISNLSIKRILPRGYFIGKEDYFTKEMDGDYYDNSGLVVSGHFDTFNVVAIHNAEKSLPRFTTNDPNALTLKYSDGSSYRGCLVAGKKSGRGVYSEKEGVFTDAEWKDDEVVKVYRSLSKDKAVGIKVDNFTYDGEIDEQGKMKGQGKITFDSGETLEGEFDGPMCKGVKIMLRPNGTRIIMKGSFINALADGDVKVTYDIPELKVPVSITLKMKEGMFEDGTYKYDTNPFGLKVLNYKNNKLDGKCDCINFDASIALGANYKDGRLDGPCKLVMLDGTSHEQVFEKGMLKKGYESYASGNYFEGEFIDGKRHKGTYYFVNGNRFEGDFNSEGKILKGKCYYSDGTIFEGDFQNEIRHKGTLVSSNGSRFVGELDQEGRPLKGIIYYLNGDRFEGDFVDGKRLKGTYYIANGNYFVGDFIDGKRHKGIYYFANGARYEGEYDENEQRKKGKIYYTSGEHFEGEFKNGNMYYGTYYYSDGGRFEGYFEENGDNLKGTSYLASGDRFEGDFKNGEWSKGTYTFVSGEKFVGEFRNGDRYKGINYSADGEKQKIDYSRGK